MSDTVKVIQEVPVIQRVVTAGPVGPKGDKGDTGPAGPRGEKGNTGSQGPVGATGVAGATGPAGATGAQGPKGDTGATGAAGTNGTNGTNGAAGATGAKGDKGDTGSTGATGATGPAGPNVDSGWISVTTFSNSYTARSLYPINYRKLNGVVWLSGQLYNSTAPTAGVAAFTLPAGYRPKLDNVRLLTTAGHLLIILPDGTVNIQAATAVTSGRGWSLDNMSFPADN